MASWAISRFRITCGVTESLRWFASWKRAPCALACNATTLSGRVARLQSWLSAAVPLIGAVTGRSRKRGFKIRRRRCRLAPPPLPGHARGRSSETLPRTGGEGREGMQGNRAYEETPHVSPNLDRRSAGRDVVPVHSRRESRRRQVSQLGGALEARQPGGCLGSDQTGGARAAAAAHA